MSLFISCPACGKQYRVPDERAGMSVACKQCGETINIPESVDPWDQESSLPPPTARGSRRTARQDSRRRQHKMRSLSLILGSLSAVLLVGGIVLFTLLREPAGQPDVAQHKPPEGKVGEPSETKVDERPEGRMGSASQSPVTVRRGDNSGGDNTVSDGGYRSGNPPARTRPGNAATDRPATTASDLSAARTVDIPGDAVGWSMSWDPVTMPARSFSVPMELLRQRGQILAIRFAPPEAGRVVVHKWDRPRMGGSSRAERERHTMYWLDCYDLNTGRHLRQVELHGEFQLVDVSPDGKLVLLRSKGGPSAAVGLGDGNCLHVYSLEDGSHVVSWQPFGGSGGYPPLEPTQPVFLNSEHVLVTGGLSGMYSLMSRDRLAVYRLPECSAVYVMDRVDRAVNGFVSPKRECYVVQSRQRGAGGHSARLLAFEALTGRCLGTIDRPAAQTKLMSILFHPNGKALSAAIGKSLYTWDSKNGQLQSEVELEVAPSQSLEWRTPRHVLIDHNLVFDVGRQDISMRMTLTTGARQRHQGMHAFGSPDGRQWYSVGPRADDPQFLMAVSVSDLGRVGKSAGQRPPVIPPGTKISLEFDLKATPANPDFEQRVSETIGQILARNGVTIARGEQKRLLIQIKETNTGRTFPLRVQDLNSFETTTHNVPERNLDAELKLIDSSGRTMWQRKASRGPQRGGVMKPNVDPVRQCLDRRWTFMRSFCGNAPNDMFPGSSEAGVFTGAEVELTLDGIRSKGAL